MLEDFITMEEIKDFVEQLKPGLTEVQYELLLFVCGLLKNEGDASIVEIDGEKIAIDKFLSPIIKDLNSHGYRTLACCSGLQEEHRNAKFGHNAPYLSFAYNEQLFDKLGKETDSLGIKVRIGSAYLQKSVSISIPFADDETLKKKWLGLRDFLLQYE